MSKVDRARGEGVTAFVLGCDRSDNPYYKQGLDMSKAWRDGWEIGKYNKAGKDKAKRLEKARQVDESTVTLTYLGNTLTVDPDTLHILISEGVQYFTYRAFPCDSDKYGERVASSILDLLLRTGQFKR